MTPSADYYYGLGSEEDSFLEAMQADGVTESFHFMQEGYDGEDFSKESIFNCRFENCVFSNCNFEDTRFVNCEFSNVLMEGCDLTDVDFEDSTVEGYGTIYGLEIKNSCLSGATFHAANIQGLKLIGCDVTGATGLQRVESMSPEIQDCKMHPLQNMGTAVACFMVGMATMIGSAFKSSGSSSTTSSSYTSYKPPSTKAFLFCSKGITDFFKEEKNAEKAVCTTHKENTTVSASAG